MNNNLFHRAWPFTPGEVGWVPLTGLPLVLSVLLCASYSAGIEVVEAERLGISASTVEFHKKRIKIKLHARGLASIVRQAIKAGLIEP